LYHPKVTNTIDNISGQFSPAHQAFIILLGGSNVTLLTDGESALKNKKKLKKSLFSSHLRVWSWSRIEVPVNTPTNLHFCARKQEASKITRNQRCATTKPKQQQRQAMCDEQFTVVLAQRERCCYNF